MKIVSLNVWGGRANEPLMQFLRDHQDVDIFCFQEVYHDAHGKDNLWINDGVNFDVLTHIQSVLQDYEFFFHPHLGDWWGLAMFVKKSIPIFEVGEQYVHSYKGFDFNMEILGHTAKNVQYLRTQLNGRPITVMNFHGLWNGQGKGDTDARILQSKKLVEVINNLPQEDFVLGGDFNLSPDTESLKMLVDELSVRDLIAESGVTSTRTSIYQKENKFADYMLTSAGIKVIDFKVLPDECSDHCPLYIEVE